MAEGADLLVAQTVLELGLGVDAATHAAGQVRGGFRRGHH
jgi:hypothetical protein